MRSGASEHSFFQKCSPTRQREGSRRTTKEEKPRSNVIPLSWLCGFLSCNHRKHSAHQHDIRGPLATPPSQVIQSTHYGSVRFHTRDAVDSVVDNARARLVFPLSTCPMMPIFTFSTLLGARESAATSSSVAILQAPPSSSTEFAHGLVQALEATAPNLLRVSAEKQQR